MEPTAPRWTTQADAAGSQMTLKPRIFAVTEKKKKRVDIVEASARGCQRAAAARELNGKSQLRVQNACEFIARPIIRRNLFFFEHWAQINMNQCDGDTTWRRTAVQVPAAICLQR